MDIRLLFPPPMLINLCYLKRETGKHKYQMVPQMWPILYLNCRQKNLLIFHVWSTGKLKLVLLSSSIRLVDFVADEQLCFSLATPALLLWPSQSIPHPSCYCHSLPSLNVSWIKETFLHFTKWKKKSICNLKEKRNAEAEHSELQMYSAYVIWCMHL